LQAWAESIGGIHYPLLSDFWPHGKIAEKYRVLRPTGTSERAIFIIDEKGLIQYIDIHDIDEQPSNEVLFTELARISPTFDQQIVTRLEPKGQPLPHGGVVLYCTNWCPDCKKARAWLKAKGIPFTEVDVTAFPGASEQVRKWAGGNLTTPTFDIDGTILVDFDEDTLSSILTKKKA
jgi:glutaredoxin